MVYSAGVRSFFLLLSRLRLVQTWMETSPAAERLAGRFIAGKTLDQAVAVTRKLNQEGITVTLDHLGESVTSLKEAAAARDVYLRTLDAIHHHGLQANVSLKLSQFGIDISYDQCRANVEQLVRRAPIWAASSGSIWNPVNTPIGLSIWRWIFSRVTGRWAW